jgi:hypothetical protein
LVRERKGIGSGVIHCQSKKEFKTRDEHLTSVESGSESIRKSAGRIKTRGRKGEA